jgi:chromosome segregation protein
LNIKKIEIFGFKSFADKLVIDFNGGINCIVGPNGCGKSNVADAIRWVLGEQSAKVLRAQKSMSELIFVGTKNRRSLSYCEVSLYFDNSQRTYPIDYDELVISRKLYRSGESEYSINNEKVKLREIIDLFRDTGIGREGYSIIGQGRIDDILSAKPEERRKIFEEAAGISKFKVKRLEAERKLAQARENMVRIYDRMVNLEKDLEPLEKEAEDARKARQIKEQLKVLEVNTYLYQRENNSEKKKEIDLQLQNIDKKLAEQQTKLDKINENYQNARAELNNIDETSKAFYDKKLQLSLKNQRIMGQHEMTLSKLEELKKLDIELNMELSRKEAELDETKYRLQSKKQEKEDRLKELVLLRQEESELAEKCEKAEEQFRLKAKELEDTNKFILNYSDKKGEIKAELASLKAQIDGLTEIISQDKETLKALKLSYNDAAKKKAAIDEEIAKSELEYAEKEAQKRDIDGKHAQYLEYLEQAQNQSNEIKQKINSLTTRAEMLEEYKKGYGGYAESVKKIMNCGDEEALSKIQGLVGQVITVSPNLQAAMEIALGRSIHNIITQDEDDTAFLINFLKKNDYGRATFLALSKITPRRLKNEYRGVLEEKGCMGLACDLIKYDRKFRNIFEFLLGSVVIVEDMDTARRLSNKYRSAFRIVTLDGEDFAVGGATTGGSKPKADTGILSRDAVLKDIYKEITVLTDKHKVILNEIEEYKKELKLLENASSVLQNQLVKLDKDISANKERQASLLAETQKIQSAADKSQAEIDQKLSVLKDKEERYKAESKKINDAENKKVSADELLGRLRAEYAAKEGEKTLLNKRMTEMKLKVNTLQHTVSGAENDINAYENDIKHITSAITDLKTRICVNSAALERISKELTTLKFTEEEQLELNEIENKIKEIDNYKLELKEKQEKYRMEESACKEVIMDLTVKRSNLTNFLDNIESDTMELEQKITEDYELSYEQALALKKDDFNEDKALKEIRRLKRELAKLGEINEKAIEQYADKSQEYQELSTHYKDITDAEQSLMGTISELTKKMEITFKENFEKIQENFKVIFKEMFEGGRGYLKLDMSQGESVLDAGIEIFAEPPGKVLNNIALLSGGERALTAIAILFAIIKLKPMPFCVLDEIEASLDDANAYLFARYLRKFSGNTQFIVITHRKPTMELADCLYGVTMQEKGVSKIVRVKLSAALKNAG